MADAPRTAQREIWITGVGIASCLGEGPDAHWQGLSQPPSRPDLETWAPYGVHRLAPLDLDKQIPKKGDQRQMEPWQRIGCYAAGLALDHAAAKGNAELLAQMDMIVAAGGGERDEAVDLSVLSGLLQAKEPGAFLNERLMGDLRPTLFLAQLSNLLAGNISIVHGVTGSSRTFMGEEGAGADAVRVAFSRIAAGQSRIALVGGAYNAERYEVLLHYVLGGVAWKGEPTSIWQRANAGGGMTLASLGAFLVIEEAEHARTRGAKPLARLRAVETRQARRHPGSVAASLQHMWSAIAPNVASSGLAVLSGAAGAAPATAEEQQFLMSHVLARQGGAAVRATGNHIGHGLEPQFPMNIALAAIALGHGRIFPSFDTSGIEHAMDAPLKQVAVTGVGHWRGEALALLEAVQ